MIAAIRMDDRQTTMGLSHVYIYAQVDSGSLNAREPFLALVASRTPIYM